ncbi:hypothetical protein BRAO375_3700003 [Bradyrhizobium sp. ORS 375]|nr:hypothetical protein BRAO375_3700003 [Bradyrhizobium sp. ORS 375]
MVLEIIEWALSLDAHVRKGERGVTIVYADRFVPSDERQRAREVGEEAQAIPVLKRFTVFNTDQCNGLAEDIATVAPLPPPRAVEPMVETLIANSGVDFRVGGSCVLRASRRFRAGATASGVLRAGQLASHGFA